MPNTPNMSKIAGKKIFYQKKLKKGVCSEIMNQTQTEFDRPRQRKNPTQNQYQNRNIKNTGLVPVRHNKSVHPVQKQPVQLINTEQNSTLYIFDTGVQTKQIQPYIKETTIENAKKIKKISEAYDIEVTAVWASWSGPCAWNFYEGPATLGIVPPAYRSMRLKELMSGGDFAYHMGVTDIITHAGFIPENPDNPDFIGVVSALRYLAGYLKSRGQYFLFETGQETPVTLLRTIEEAGTGNLGINLDTANLILYGKGNTVDSLDVFGKYVRNTHCKDGFYPTSGKNLGREVPLGQGKANFPGVIKKLNELEYTGPYIIEREISGEQQQKDIVMARDFIRSLLDEA